MQIPDIPIDEESRIKSLRALEILDTEAEERFDRLTRLAAHLFQVPIALVSFIDTNRQWFKSCVGLDVCETEREISFCGHAILGNELFIVPDTLDDPRFADNPLVTGPPNIRFYVGRVLKSPDGKNLGTLCIIDSKPRACSSEDFTALEDLAVMAEELLTSIQISSIDNLTKISNRHGFETLAQKSLEMCKRQHLPFSIICFDLDNFKPINDSYGHTEGDQALILFATALTSTFRDSDVIARIGGDEFVVLMTDTKTSSITLILERLQTELIHLAQSKDYSINFSYGISSSNEVTETIDSYIHQADKLMYQHKRSK